MWGSYSNIPKAIFYLLKGDYNWRRGQASPLIVGEHCMLSRLEPQGGKHPSAGRPQVRSLQHAGQLGGDEGMLSNFRVLTMSVQKMSHSVIPRKVLESSSASLSAVHTSKLQAGNWNSGERGLAALRRPEDQGRSKHRLG